jgi:hypothetical protein
LSHVQIKELLLVVLFSVAEMLHKV